MKRIVRSTPESPHKGRADGGISRPGRGQPAFLAGGPFATWGIFRSRRASTIIEVAMAIVILSVGIPPLMSAFAEGAFQSRRGGQATKASFLAVERMEDIIATRYASASGYANVNSTNFPDNNLSISGFTGFKRTVTISYVNADLSAAGSDQGYKKVLVKVTWNNASEQITIERIFANFAS